MKIESLFINNLSKKLNKGYELKSVSIRMYQGEILGIAGAHDSGVLTLAEIFSGRAAPDEGTLSVFEQPVEIDHKTDMARYGVYYIDPTPKLHVDFIVAESICTTNPPVIKGRWVNRKKMIRAAAAILKKYNVEIDPNKKTYQLDAYEKSIVEIMRATIMGAKIIILGNVITPLEKEKNKKYYRLLKDIAADGKTVVLIGMDTNVLMDVADRLYIMRAGKVDGVYHKDKFEKSIANSIFVKKQGNAGSRMDAQGGSEIVLRMENVGVRGCLIEHAVLRKGEAINFVDPDGNGFGLIERVLNGEEKYSGDIYINETLVRLNSREKAVKNGIACLTRYDSPEMVFENLTIGDNILLIKLREKLKYGLINRRWCDFAANEYLIDNGLPGEYKKLFPCEVGAETRAMIPRIKWDAVKPAIVVMKDFLMGMDADMKADAFHYINKLKSRGTGIVLCSSATEKLTGYCDCTCMVKNTYSG